jgi:phospholipid/cholesterol/gamma-HCH transport system substrate-binding protein
MESNKRKIILAIFIVVGFVLFVIAVFVIGSRQNLFTSTFNLTSVFETVSGLQGGSSVRFNGINVGTVDNIEITGVDKVKIRMIIVSSVKPFIKKDSKATVISEGLVGNKIVEITSGSADVPSVDDGDDLIALRPVEAEQIFKSLKKTSENADSLSRGLAELVTKINTGQGTIGQLIGNDQLYRTIDQTINGFSSSTAVLNQAMRKISGNVDAVSEDITNLTPKIREITRNIAEITVKMNSSQSIVGTLLTDTVFANNLKGIIINANKTTANLEQGSNSFTQNMEALKHNFLFKGYFEDIGYWDKTDFEKDIEKQRLQLKLREEELNQREKKLEELEKKTKEEEKD